MGMKSRPADSGHRPAVKGLADALFSKVQQRVLGLLFGDPSRTFYANEIIGLAQSGTGAVQRELSRLEASGIVIAHRVGRQKHYQANPKSPVFAELRGLVLKTCGLADVLRAALALHAESIFAAFVYGSVAKHEDTSESDIDLLILSDHLAYAELFAVLEPAATTLARKVAPTIYSRQEFRDRRASGNAFLARILAQPRLWLIGGDDELAI